MEQGNMNRVLRRVAVIMGIVLLVISIQWSQDGFNFDIAGDSGGTNIAILIGYSIAVAVTIVQFVFSTNLRELNASLIVFGLIAYAYSIYTNYQGIVHMQGASPNHVMAAILGFAMDGVPEPLIAWGLKESLTGDFVGNLFKGLWSFASGQPLGGKQQKQEQGQGKQVVNQGRRSEDNNGHKKSISPELMAKIRENQNKQRAVPYNDHNLRNR